LIHDISCFESLIFIIFGLKFWYSWDEILIFDAHIADRFEMLIHRDSKFWYLILVILKFWYWGPSYCKFAIFENFLNNEKLPKNLKNGSIILAKSWQIDSFWVQNLENQTHLWNKTVKKVPISCIARTPMSDNRTVHLTL